ncbi:Protein FAR1-related sequence 5 [Vitis vinifera]|uniref:Protein FAR1-related sequence 5 n=1 Tax=Vitis vinifera TaxID=29760 RepID=A0A438DQL1_VITVI|nr:Protein FAR1-related sequence 5 [Vitis vinifera]
MTLSNSVYLQMMQSVKEKTIKREFEVKEEDVVNDDAFIGATYDLGGNGLKQKVLKGISDEEVYKLQFDRIDEAETFYNMLARVAGFSIRKDDLKRDKNGDIISRKWVCSREGQRATKFIENDKRQREPRSLTRVGCEAAFRVGLNRKDGKWIVKEFIGDHNHNLVDAINTQFLRSHRTISNPDKAQVDVLRKVGVKTTQIMDYMVKQSGGHEHVGFTQKDIYNHVDAMRRSEIKDGDAEAALAYLCGKAEMDSSFFYKFNIDEESRLANLFWADSTARMDYACFGDVLAFDTTYRTNAYKKPLVVLVGVNHHHQTVVFGCALLIDESVGTYEWVLETFLDAMMNKKPISVVTDGDKAMRKAIKKVLPDTCHRLCSWHLQRNAFTNVHIKDFSSIFARCMFMRGNEEEFEKVWHEMVANLGLNENRWVTEIYGKRKRWAEAYLRGNFFGGMRTTQRAILRIRQNEAKAEFESNNSSPVLSTKLAILENHAATVYTKESFLKFREEMKNAELFFVVGLVEHLEEIPQSCIMKRWTKLAKVYTRSVPVNETDNNMDRKKIASDGATGTNQVRDPNIVKTKGNPGKVAMNVQKGRRCSRCKRVGHTIRKCPEATIPQNAQPGYMEETNLSSQCDIQREMMPSTNSSVDIFATLHGMLGEQLPNDPSDMYIDWGELNNWLPVEKFSQPVEAILHPVATVKKWLNRLIPSSQPVDPSRSTGSRSDRPVEVGLTYPLPVDQIPQPVDAHLHPVATG